MKHSAFYTLLIACTVAMLGVAQVSAKRTAVPKIYAFGLAASFTDSLVHFTEIQTLDSAWVELKTGFLQNRDTYSYQLRDYLDSSLKLPHRTCIVFYDQKREKLEKKYQKMRQLYTHPKAGRQTFDVHTISTGDFHFSVIDLSDEIASEVQDEAEMAKMRKELKAQKKEEKKNKKKQKKDNKQDEE